MKTIIKQSIAALSVISSASTLNASVLDSLSGTTADGVNYTIAGSTAATDPTFLTGGGIETAGNSGATITFSFTQAVDFTITSLATSDSGRVVFDGTTANNVFTGDSGSWTYNVGSIDINEVISGSTATVNDTTGGTAANTNVSYTDDWGTLELTGAQEITWTTSNATNYEAFTFSAVAASVPEPSSTALLGLGGLALLARRRR